MQPLISIIIPCRNEEKYIEACLKSLAEDQTYPKESLEILVIDGASEDKTRKIVEEYIKKHPEINIKLLENPNKFTSFGLNIGIRTARGEIIVRADAHTQYPPEYIKVSVDYLLKGYKKEEVDSVGGVIETPSIKDIATVIKDRKSQIKTRAIALCLSHPFGAASSFRLGTTEPRFVDTVFAGCYKKEVFNKIGLFNENLVRSQDLEFNLRLKRAGGKILLVPDIKFRYYPKSSFWEFFQHNFLDGIWAIYPLKFTKTFFQPRHYIPLFFVLSLIVSLIFSFFLPFFRWLFFFIVGFYLLVNISFSCKIAKKERNFAYLYFMLIAFACRHFGYGAGSISGLIKLLTF